MNKIVSKPVCLLLALALVFSLAAVVLTFAPPSVASAQDDGMVFCQTSVANYTDTGWGANTTHNFSVPTGATGGYVLVEFRGDFEGWSYNWDWEEDDFIEVYIDGDYIGRDRGHWDDCDERWTEATWSLTAEQMSDWAADGMISVRVANSEDVDDECEPDQHRVTLCYTTALPVTCDESLISYTGNGTATIHNFSVPSGATALAYVVVEFRGDFDTWSYDWDWEEDEFIEVYIDGDYIGRDQGHWDECSENWTAATWALSAAQVSGWAADGMISVTVENSEAVDNFCTEEEDDTYNQHRVTLCYTEPEGPPVGGEAYPLSRISVLAPWIAVGVVLAGGIAWYVLRRRRT